MLPEDLTTWRLSEKPWGHERVCAATDGYTMKLIVVMPGKRTSSQRHRRKHETYYVITCSGDARVELGDHTIVPYEGLFISIGPGVVHRVTGYMAYIEASTPEDPDDIERLADDYGRADA